MKSQKNSPEKPVFLRHYSVFLILIWTIVVGSSLVWTGYQGYKEAEGMAGQEAISSLQMDLAYRLWNTNLGGVYAAVTKQTRPDPYLNHVNERDIDTPSGRTLTLINPANMTAFLSMSPRNG